MKHPGGWIALVSMVGAGCGSTVTDTRAPRTDAAVDGSSLDAPDAAVDLTRPPADRNPCAPERIVDLDRVGIATALGVGVVLEHAAQPEALVGGAPGSACAPLYRPTVLRFRAPRAGLLQVSLFASETSGVRVEARRLVRCDVDAVVTACDRLVQHGYGAGRPGQLLGAVAEGESVEVVVGLAPMRPRALFVEPGRVAVSLGVLPPLPAGAPCGPEDPDVCAPGLACNAPSPDAEGRCGPPGAAGDDCLRHRCGAGLVCHAGLCAAPLAPGARCLPDLHGAPCAEGSDCVRRGAAFVCAAPGSLGAQCRSTEASARCDDGLTCDASGRCGPPREPGVVCDATDPCPEGLRCAPGNPARCVAPGAAGGACVGERSTCGPGLVCARMEDTCVPALAEGAACEAFNRGGPECGPGLVCSFNRCTPTGAEGQPCSRDGRQQDCAAPLICVGFRCATPPGLGETCAPGPRCAAGLRCDRTTCVRAGGRGEACRVFEPRCDPGLGCDADRCRDETPVGAICNPGASCTEPLRCTPAFDGNVRCFRFLPVACGAGCAAGTVCRGGECVVDGRCDRLRFDLPQPCGDDRFCLPAGDGTLACVPSGARGGPCRDDRAVPCDDGLICAGRQCVPLLAEGAACRVDRWQRGACRAGLVCRPADDCAATAGCAWPSAPGDQTGSCRARDRAGARGGDCVRAPDGRPRCDDGLACDAASLRCLAPPPDGEGGPGLACRADLLRPCDDGLRCVGERCAVVRREGETCGPDATSVCADGLDCLRVADVESRCLRVGAEATPCAGPERMTCAPGLACVGATCVRAIPLGAPCDEGSRCESGAVCGAPLVGPRVCVRLGSPGAPCDREPRCAAGLGCHDACVPLRLAGQPCDPDLRADVCEARYRCLGGVCVGPPEGDDCADGRCRDGLRCVANTCVRPRDPGEPCTPSDPRTTCRADSACAADSTCRVLGTPDARCRRGPGAACDAGLRCDLVADRCAP